MGFGCWQISGNHKSAQGNPNGWGHISKTEATKLIHTALDNGIQFFDTAFGYGHGRSETLLGQAIASAQTNTDPVVCTKIPIDNHKHSSNTLSERFTENVESSLKRLKRDRIDVLLIHNPPDTIDWNRFDKSLINQLQESGKVRTFGISAKSFAGLRNAVESKFGTCVQWSFNMFERRPMEVFPKITENNMNFIARSPLSRGLLSSKYVNEDFRFESSDFRSTLSSNWIDWVCSNIERLELSEMEKENLSKIAIQFCTKFPEVSVVIPGMKQLYYLQEYLAIQNSQFLSSSLMSRIHSSTKSCYPQWR
jgi:aryl-alcohol dehydrogenase-like predicted oxidoreductase